MHAAHRLADEYPDGQLYADMADDTRGNSGADLLPPFLRALGVPPEAVPSQHPEAAALYRSMTTGRRLLVVLDGVTTAAQVRPLLPGSATCAALVTSRNELADLLVSPGGHVLALGALAPGHARELLCRVLGERRVLAEEAAAARLVVRCRGLPRALRAAGVRLAATGQSIASYLEEIAESDPVAVLPPARRRRIAPAGGPERTHPHATERAG